LLSILSAELAITPSEIMYSPTHGVVPPLCATTSWVKKSEDGYSYSRGSNPNLAYLQAELAKQYQEEACCLFPSGLAAIFALFYTRIEPNAIFLVSHELYDDTYDMLDSLQQKFQGFEYIQVDMRDNEDLLYKTDQYHERINLIYFESCSNPSGQVPDFDLIAELASTYTIAVDNSWLSPVLFNPFKYKVDYVIDSLSKYLGGGVSIMGSMVGSAKKMQVIQEYAHQAGVHVSPFDAWQICEEMKTVQLKVRSISEKTLKLAESLEYSPVINRALHPGLPSHSSYERAQKYFLGNPGVIFLHINSEPETIVPQIHASSSLLYATSYSKSETLVNPYLNTGDSKFYDPVAHWEKLGLTNREGTWFRLAVGWNADVEAVRTDVLTLANL